MMEREEPGELQLNGSPSTGQDEYCCQDTAQRECDSDNICLFAVRSGKLRVLDCFPLASLAACANGADAANLLRLKLQGSLPAGSDWMLRIPPIGIDGFDVILRSCLPRASIRVNFGGLEELLETLDAALVWVGRALSASYQLRTTSFGGCARMCGLPFRAFRHVAESVKRNDLCSLRTIGADTGPARTADSRATVLPDRSVAESGSGYHPF